MATKLKSPVNRELVATCATKKGRICSPMDVGSRSVIVTLNPEETISFRVKGTRTVYSMHLITAFAIAQKMQLMEDYNEKMSEYNLKRKAGYTRLRRPKKPFVKSSYLK